MLIIASLAAVHFNIRRLDHSSQLVIGKVHSIMWSSPTIEEIRDVLHWFGICCYLDHTGKAANMDSGPMTTRCSGY